MRLGILNMTNITYNLSETLIKNVYIRILTRETDGVGRLTIHYDWINCRHKKQKQKQNKNNRGSEQFPSRGVGRVCCCPRVVSLAPSRSLTLSQPPSVGNINKKYKKKKIIIETEEWLWKKIMEKNRDKDYGWRKQGKVMGGGGRRMGSSFPPSWRLKWK